jgi:transforming growth factor-beta-induced protein
MKKFYQVVAVVSIVVLSSVPFSFANCSGCSVGTTSAKADHSSDIIGVAKSAGSFNTLVAAVKAAGLVETLQGEGPFTVFAPTDDAFAKLPKGTVESLLKPENKSKLVSILTYHVVPGKVTAKKVVGLNGALTVNGQRIAINAGKKGVSIDNAKVVKTDVEASNGIIHVIDSVILPESKNVVEIASGAGSFGTLVAAVKAAGLAEALMGKGPFTVFAPTDDAFAKLPAGTVESLLKPENREKLQTILKLHVVPGRVYSEKVLSSSSLDTLASMELKPALNNGAAEINGSGIVKTDINASNGVIHVIDSVILPKTEVSSIEKARMTIVNAINHGAPMYNRGHHGTCAMIYENSSMTLLEISDVPSEVHEMIETALAFKNRTPSPTAQAWILRAGLDEAYSRLNSM